MFKEVVETLLAINKYKVSERCIKEPIEYHVSSHKKDGTEEKWLVLSTIRYERGGKECMQFKSTSLIHGVIAPTGKYGC